MEMMHYYNCFDDFEKWPDAWLYTIFSNRGPGKTYSFFRGCLERNIPFIYLKRVRDDIKLLANDELSPLNPINRDTGEEYTFKKIDEGLMKVVNKKSGQPDATLGIAIAASIAYRFKGLGQKVDPAFICFDEFMPQIGERVKKNEGDLILDFYSTIARDRERRGKPPLKLVLFANTTTLYCPLTLTLNLIEPIETMVEKSQAVFYDADKGEFFRHIKRSASMDNSGMMFEALKETQWGKMAYNAEFSYNDRSKVKKQNVNGCVVECAFVYNNAEYYIYFNRQKSNYYCGRQKPGKGEYEVFDLENDADARRFFRDYVIFLKNEITDNNMLFCDYTSYYLIYNYKKLMDI